MKEACPEVRPARTRGRHLPWPHYSILAVISAVVVGGTVLQNRMPAADLMKDPLVVASVTDACCGPLLGAVWNFGVLLWAATAAVCLFTALRIGLAHGLRPAAFPLAAGALIAMLALDDLYLLHEFVWPHLGVPQPAVLAIYGSISGAYLLFFRDRLRAGRASLLAIALVAFGVSIGVDLVWASPDVLLEDGAKFVGIVAWAVFHTDAMLRLLEPARGVT